ncbi:hypothetical protein B0A55_00312 [Friedmanniomyces simplex]|uniref:RRM domain-containing protein n=1 Tax=Friedmanniomyces simplex TaxID=329884 RepID=A0A4U0Y5Z4_9PEZI|nr:hypothetical protein B0A55_00312 [Friedmanniomyces simplex]
MSRNSVKLPSEANRALLVKGLPYNCSTEDLFTLFAKFGAVRQIRQGIASNTKGTAFVVYEDVMDAKSACDKLNGYNFQNRYLVVLYHQPEKMAKAQADLAERNKEEKKGRKNISNEKGGSVKRQDSGYSASASLNGSEPKTRDFALYSRKADANVIMSAKNTPRKAAASASGATVAIKAGKEQGSCWRRMKVTAFSKLAGKP